MSETEAEQNSEPESNWYQHKPAGRRGDYCLPVDFVEVEEPPLNNPNDEYMIHVCPSCGHGISAYQPNYSGMADNFKECVCAECITALFRYTGIVTTESVYNSSSDYLTVKNIHRYLKNRADQMFWTGEMGRVDPRMMHGMDEPPVPILGVKDTINRIVDRWEPRCPCCGVLESSDVEFDFHHWDYENDIGCNLCRDCHTYIHDDMRASEQDDEYGKWKLNAIGRIHQRSKENGLSYDDASEVFQRFNIEAPAKHKRDLEHKMRREDDE